MVFVDANPAKIEWGKAHGVGVDRLPRLPARFVPFAEWQPGPGATVWLCTKCYETLPCSHACPRSQRYSGAKRPLDPALDAHGHAWEGIASFISECIPNQTHTRITRRGRLHLGLRSLRAFEKKGTVPSRQGDSPLFFRTL